MVVGVFSIVLFNLADTYFVGQLGTEPLAAMGFIFPVITFYGYLALGLGVGASSVVSRAIGEGNPEKAQKLATHSLLLALAIVIVIVMIGLVTIEPLFSMMGADDKVLVLIKEYMTIWYIGMIFVVFPMVGNNIIRATGDTFYPAMVMMLAAGINIVLDPLLIFGLLGFPKMGLRGAALATVIGRCTTMIVAFSLLFFREKLISFSKSTFHRVWDSWKKILYIGIPSSGMNIMIPLAMAVITRIISDYGNNAVAAIAPGTRIQFFALMPIMALRAVIIPFTGQNWGARMKQRAHRAQVLSNRFSILWGFFCFGVLAFTARPLANLFTEKQAVEDYIVLYLRVVPLGYGLLGVNLLAGAAFNAINRPLTALFLSAIRLLVFYIPMAWLGSVLMGVSGIFWGMAIANILAGLVSLVYLGKTF